MLAGVVLHDIGKLQELAYEGGGGSYTRDGNLVGHIGARDDDGPRSHATASPDFPIELRAQIEHLVASHHGTREYGSPVEPKTIEAFILASVDELDAKLNQVRRAIEEDPSDDEFTAWNKRLGRVLYKGPKTLDHLPVPSVSGIPSHSAAAMMKEIDVIVNAAPKPRLCTIVPTMNGAIALSSRPLL